MWNVKCVSSSSCFQPGEGPCGGLLRDYTTWSCTKVGTFLMFPTAQLGCKCIKPLPGSNNTQTFHIRTIWTDCTPPTIITCREADSYSVLKSKLNIWGLQFPVWLKHFGLDVSGYPQTALTKQRESLEEPLKVFTLPSHQHSGFWIPGDGEETINTLRIHSSFTILDETLTCCFKTQMPLVFKHIQHNGRN